MTTWTDDNGDVIATDTFTSRCPDCQDPIQTTDGVSEAHACEMPERLRGLIGQAWADGERWVQDHPEQYGLVRVDDPNGAPHE